MGFQIPELWPQVNTRIRTTNPISEPVMGLSVPLFPLQVKAATALGIGQWLRSHCCCLPSFLFVLTQLMRNNSWREHPGSAGVQRERAGRACEGQHWAPWLFPVISQQQGIEQRSHCRQAHIQTCPDTVGPPCCPGHATPVCHAFSSFCSFHLHSLLSP